MSTSFIMNGKLLVIALGLISASLQQAPACAASDWLLKFGFNATAPTVVAGGICQGFYDVGGACVDSAAVKNYLSALSTRYSSRATDASDTASLLSLEDTYFKAVNNNQTLLNKPISTGLGGIFDSIVNTLNTVFNNAKDFFTSLWKNASAWVLKIFNKTSGAINPCFQAWNNLANGAFCALTSSNALAKLSVTSGANTYYSFQANTTSAGLELSKCLPLIDNYCTLTYGISISDTTNFNRTYNWADNGFPKQACMDLQTNYNCTTSVCNTTKYGILIANFNTEDFNFVRNPDDLQALYKFLKQNTIQQPSAYVPISQNLQKGVVFASVDAGSDFQAFGSKSGIVIPTYTGDNTKFTVSSSKAFLTSIITFFGLIVMLLK